MRLPQLCKERLGESAKLRQSADVWGWLNLNIPGWSENGQSAKDMVEGVVSSILETCGREEGCQNRVGLVCQAHLLLMKVAMKGREIPKAVGSRKRRK